MNPASMSSSAPLLSGTIEADEEVSHARGNIAAAPTAKATRPAEVLVPGTTADGQVRGSVEEGGIVGYRSISTP